MKLRTSFFNPAVLKKDITRFAPLWGLYTFYVVMYLMTQNSRSAAYFASNINYTLQATCALNACYASLAALLLFGDLFKTRLCGALHAMPLRRDGWFLTHSISALLFCIVPNLLGAVIASFMLDTFWFLAWAWFALSVMLFVCFYGIAAFCIQCAGTGLGAAVVYGTVNYLPMLVLALIKCFYEPMLYGVYIQENTLMRFSPALYLSTLKFVDFDFTYKTDVFVYHGLVGRSWLYALFAMLAGVAFLVAAVFMYRKRQLERAGDFIAFRPAKPVFLVLYALGAGAAIYSMGIVTTAASLVFLPLMFGLAIGWFTGKMLLEKQVNVFKKKTFLGFGIFLAVFLLTVGITRLDPLGITRYVPKADQVARVEVSTSSYAYSRSPYAVYDPTQIEKLTQIHQKLVNNRDTDTSAAHLWLTYTLKNGKTVERKYQLDVNSQDGQWLKTVYSQPEAVLGSSDLNALKRSIRVAEVYKYNEKYVEQPDRLSWLCDPKNHDALLDALMADCLAGSMTQLNEYRMGQESVATLYLQFGTETQTVLIYEDCRNTTAFLKALWPQTQ